MEFNDLGYAGRFIKEREDPSLFEKIFRFFFPSAIIEKKVQFADVSFWQGNIDWATLSTKAPGVIIRVGQNIWPDTQFKNNWAGAKATGVKRGAYWFYDDKVSPLSQANLLISSLKDDPPEMEVFIDWEKSYGGPYTGLKNVVSMMKLVEQGLPNTKVGMYTGYYWFTDNSNSSSNSAEYSYLSTKPLWLAWYTSNSDYVLVPKPWTKVTHWQWGTPVLGIEWGTETKEIDMNWFNGTVEQFNQSYGGTVVIPPPTGEDMADITHNNGVREITGRLFDSDFKATVIPYSSVSSATYEYAVGKCVKVESLNGYDFAVNFTPFTSCRPNLGLRIGGYTHEAYHNYNPYLSLDGVPVITHVARSFTNYKTTSQAFRYIIENGTKNPAVAANPQNYPDWYNLNPLVLVGTRSNGDLVIISVKGREAGVNTGWNLHEACAYGLSLGCNNMVDADGGYSVQQYLVKDGQKELYLGTTQRRDVPVFLAVKFKTPIVTGTVPPPPPPDPDPTDPPAYFYMEDPNGVRTKYNKE